MGDHAGWPTSAAATAILEFWFDQAKPRQWFRRDAGFDNTINRRFGDLHRRATAGEFDAWRAHPRFSLALIIILDQFSRNLFRDRLGAFAQDNHALAIAQGAINRRFDMIALPRERAFFYMPFMHSEAAWAQDRCVELFKARKPQGNNLSFAIEHRDIIRRFGRFPHRNSILGRKSTPEEIAYLRAGGFNP